MFQGFKDIVLPTRNAETASNAVEAANHKSETDVIVPPRASVESDSLKYIEAAIALKTEKVKENNAAIVTEILSDAQTAVAAFFVAKNALFALSLAPFAAGALPVIMLVAAVPAVLSLLSEIKKDDKDLRILNTILTKYNETQDENILDQTRLFVKMHAPHTDIDEDMARSGPPKRKVPVKLKYRNMNPTIRAMIEEKEKDIDDGINLRQIFSKQMFNDVPAKALWALKSVFNAYALSLKVCTIEMPKTFKSVKSGLSEVWRLTGRDRKHVTTTIMAPTLYESLQLLKYRQEAAPNDVSDVETESPIFNQDSKLHIRKLHTLQLDIRNNAKQRAVTAVGTTAVFSFVSLALLQSTVNFSAGNVVQGTSYLMMSALLSVPSLRVLSDRLTELAENDRDQDIRLATRMAKHGI